ncbi:hypothetical protein GU243_14115 [Pseudarthrobacter psychrotolerans]|uniref:DUF1304 domain-containing protein n=1 Tax=Pseudarthrobacter psychrotolerans TaxID=2697569 RepID=A0A6P1NPG2_9MICC|nr:hypothetical protein [Pseudarthrobacter psychrotolerans]QHK20677.1 hypothetical protein GU243_14115 [Pseudarthrobacter psychrotolerans]
MQLAQLAATTACVLLAALAVFQAALVAGAPLGRFAWGGQHNVLPAKLRTGSATSIILYVLFAYVALARAGFAAPLVNQGFTDVFCWVLTAYFALGIVLNGISRSKPERLVMTPTVVILTALYLVLALS